MCSMSNKNREILEIKLACHLRNQTKKFWEPSVIWKIKCDRFWKSKIHLRYQMWQTLEIKMTIKTKRIFPLNHLQDINIKEKNQTVNFIWYSLPMLLTASIRHTALTLLSNDSHYNLGLTYIPTHSGCQLRELH